MEPDVFSSLYLPLFSSAPPTELPMSRFWGLSLAVSSGPGSLRRSVASELKPTEACYLSSAWYGLYYHMLF